MFTLTMWDRDDGDQVSKTIDCLGVESRDIKNLKEIEKQIHILAVTANRKNNNQFFVAPQVKIVLSEGDSILREGSYDHKNNLIIWNKINDTVLRPSKVMVSE